MNVRSIAFAAVALLTTSAAIAVAPEHEPAEPQAVVRERTLLEQLAEEMREMLRAAAPEIALPALDLTLPRLDLDPR
jgi:hypothetical protein